MLFTLHRYIFRELLKVFILSGIGLTLMLSLGMILEPVHEYGVGPKQVVHLIGYFLPITLTFVLPMAALFACALVYGRFASDNELDACRASGVSLLTLVYPGLILALIVAIANLVLSFHVMPAFVHRAEQSFKANAQQIIFRNIQRRGYYEASGSGYLLYADHADIDTESLYGVVIASVESKSNRSSIGRIISAEKAIVHFSGHRRYNEVEITAYNTYQMGLENEGQAKRSTFRMEFPSLLKDDIKFKKVDELKRIRDENPMEFAPIEKACGNLYARYTIELLAKDIRTSLEKNPGSFYRLRCGESFVDFRAEDCTVHDEKNRVELRGEVIVRDGTKDPDRLYECSDAAILIEGDNLAPTLTMVMYGAVWEGEDGLPVHDYRPMIYGLIVPSSAVAETYLPASFSDKSQNDKILGALDAVIMEKVLGGSLGERISNLRNNLTKEIEDALIEIQAETHSKLVFGIGCVAMIMIGIALGIIKKDGHLLSAFGASCVPSAMLIVCIMMGRNIAKNSGIEASSGISMMWIGLGILILLCFWLYRGLLKN